MAVTNAIKLYITTCRYVIQSNPYDSETWSELHRYLPYLKQSLSCCVCGRVLHIPVGAVVGPCQHHVCKTCVGGKMRLKPTCSWCKDHDKFVENAILRTVIQCFKKLCEYLASSAIAVTLASGSNGGATSALMVAIQDGTEVRDDFSSPGPQFGLFPPKLQKVGTRRASKEEPNKQIERQTSRCDKGEGHLRGSNHLTTNDSSVLTVSPVASKSPTKKETTVLTVSPVTSKSPTKKETTVLTVSPVTSKSPTKKETSQPSKSPVSEKKQRISSPDKVIKTKRKRKSSEKNDSAKTKTSPPKSVEKVHNHDNGLIDKSLEYASLNGQNDLLPEDLMIDTNQYEMVEHTHNKDLTPADKSNSILKVRIRKIEGDHESLVKRPKHVVEPILPEETVLENVVNGELNENFEQPGYKENNRLNMPNFDQNSNSDPNTVKKRSSSKKKIVGCRCGLATPNPGKLTCCGQRCPCYSAFKGCVNCRCRGCRNPRGDTPAPHSLKVQQQQQAQQHLHTTSLVPFSGSKPQIILTPIKIENESMDFDVDV